MSLFGGIASVVGGLVQGGADYLGASAQAKAARDAQNQSYAIYKQQRKDLGPQIELGQKSANRMRDIYLDGTVPFTAAPGYDFRVAEGQKALERGAAARGRQFSGAQGKALLGYGQNIASDEYNQGFNRLAAMAGIGGAGISQANNAGAQYVTNINAAGADAAKARASAYSGIGSGINTTFNNLLSVYGNDWF